MWELTTWVRFRYAGRLRVTPAAFQKGDDAGFGDGVIRVYEM